MYKRLTIRNILWGVAIDLTCIDVGRLECTEPNLIHFKWVSGSTDHAGINYIYYLFLHE